MSGSQEIFLQNKILGFHDFFKYSGIKNKNKGGIVGGGRIGDKGGDLL